MRVAVAALVGSSVAAVPAEAFERPPSARGSAIDFHGWSRDSRLVAYTRRRIGRTRPDQRMQRFVESGEFTGFGRMVGGDVATYARERGYVAAAAPKSRRSESEVVFQVGEERLVLTIEVGRSQVWRLARGQQVLAEHAFDRIYVGFEAELHPSPDRTQAVLVMHLDTGWEIDAAIFPVSLNEQAPLPP